MTFEGVNRQAKAVESSHQTTFVAEVSAVLGEHSECSSASKGVTDGGSNASGCVNQNLLHIMWQTKPHHIIQQKTRLVLPVVRRAISIILISFETYIFLCSLVWNQIRSIKRTSYIRITRQNCKI